MQARGHQLLENGDPKKKPQKPPTLSGSRQPDTPITPPPQSPRQHSAPQLPGLWTTGSVKMLTMSKQVLSRKTPEKQKPKLVNGRLFPRAGTCFSCDRCQTMMYLWTPVPPSRGARRPKWKFARFYIFYRQNI